MSDLVELLFISAIDFDFDRFSDTNGANPFEAEMLHGEAGGDSGGIKNGGFRHDGDNSFHEEWKIGRDGSYDKPKCPKG